MTPQGPMRWYNPKLEDFEWREVPQTDEQALEMLDGSAHSPVWAETYREWRELGASIQAALIRAGEVAKAEREREKEGADTRRGRG
jgi:hypothetical protein